MKDFFFPLKVWAKNMGARYTRKAHCTQQNTARHWVAAT